MRIYELNCVKYLELGLAYNHPHYHIHFASSHGLTSLSLRAGPQFHIPHVYLDPHLQSLILNKSMGLSSHCTPLILSLN